MKNVGPSLSSEAVLEGGQRGDADTRVSATSVYEDQAFQDGVKSTRRRLCIACAMPTN